MTVPVSNTNNARDVGDAVQVSRPGGGTASGTLVEDFAAYMIEGDRLGRDWAPPHRWAVALDDGTLVFADDDDLTTAGSDAGAESAASDKGSVARRSDSAPK